MTETIPKRKAIKWVIFTPLSVSMLAANIPIALWYYRMAEAGTPFQGPPPASVIQQAVMLTAGVGLWFTVLLWWFLHRKKDFFAKLFGARMHTIGTDLGLGLALGGLWVALYGAIGWPPFATMFVCTPAKLASIPTSLSAGFCEEFLFRGFVPLMILRAGGTPKTQVLWSSLAFGLAHIMWGPVGMLFTVVLGASFAVITLWRGNVWAAVAAHTILNLCIEPGLMERAMTFTHK
jgi:membrane protease YdiL (CAAX protease family)